LAARLVEALADTYPDALHLGDTELLGASDLTVWEHARDRGLIIVTKDADFHRMSVLSGPPPKVICLRLGNCSTQDIVDLLRRRRDDISLCRTWGSRVSCFVR
jgi:predicted nuclease of predicted toxin-antitoxin system